MKFVKFSSIILVILMLCQVSYAHEIPRDEGAGAPSYSETFDEDNLDFNLNPSEYITARTAGAYNYLKQEGGELKFNKGDVSAGTSINIYFGGASTVYYQGGQYVVEFDMKKSAAGRIQFSILRQGGNEMIRNQWHTGGRITDGTLDYLDTVTFEQVDEWVNFRYLITTGQGTGTYSMWVNGILARNDHLVTYPELAHRIGGLQIQLPASDDAKNYTLSIDNVNFYKVDSSYTGVPNYITENTVLDSEGDVAEDISEGIFTSKAQLNIVDAEEYTTLPTHILAKYEKVGEIEKLVDVKVISYDAAKKLSGHTREYSASVTIPENFSDYVIKSFVWHSEVKPLTEVIVID